MSLLPVDPCSGYQRDSHPLCRPSEGVYFFIEHSITDHQVARDTTICIGNTHGCTCPVTAMEAYIQHSAPCTLLLQKSQALLLHLPAPHRIMWLWPCKLPCTQCVYQCYHRVGLPSKTFQRLDRWQSTAYLIYSGPPSWLIHPTPETWLPPSNTWNHPHLPFWGFHLGDTVLGFYSGTATKPASWFGTQANPMGTSNTHRSLYAHWYEAQLPDCSSRLPYDKRYLATAVVFWCYNPRSSGFWIKDTLNFKWS